MSNNSLSSVTPLNGFSKNFDDINLSEVSNYSLISMATPQGQNEALERAIIDTYETTLPTVGSFTKSAISETRFLGLQTDQCFVLFKYTGVDAVNELREKTTDNAYLCDQSDSWAMLRLDGERSRQVLERICPLDLHSTVFQENAVLRTMMEHLSVIIIREGLNRFLLLSPRSSATSFLHMVLTAIENTD